MTGGSSTVTLAEAELLPVTKSKVLEQTLAAFTTVPAATGAITMATLAAAWALSEPNEQDTVPAECVQLPAALVAETNVTPPGNVSLRIKSEADAGPRLVMVTV